MLIPALCAKPGNRQSDKAVPSDPDSVKLESALVPELGQAGDQHCCVRLAVSGLCMHDHEVLG